MGRQKRFANARTMTAATAMPSPMDSTRDDSSSSPKSYSSSQNGTSAMFSEVTAQYSDEDATQIPSLHGNLVRNRYRRDPLEFYEPLEPLGEGSMGSVSKVRKRSDVIGGSARPEFLKSHPPKTFFQLPSWCFPVLQRQSSDVSFTFSSTGNRVSSSDERSRMKCFSLFCPIIEQPKSSSVLDPIHEDRSVGGTLDDDQENFRQRGCWGEILQTIFPLRDSKKNHQQSKGYKKKTSSNVSSGGSSHSDSKNGGNDDDDDNLLSKEDYEQIDHHIERALKHSTSSLITYGHKDVVYALKSIHLDRVSNGDFLKELKNEVSILKELDHPHIVKCYETFNYNASLFLVLEICSGSDLYSRDPYSEQDACRIIRSVLSAVAYMHSKQITHRDLKYENIMFVSPDPDASVRIIDFGLSKKYASDTFLHDTVGTVYTMAPELLRGGYTEVVDVWSIGVISFMLLSSSMPFYGKDRKQVIKKIVKGQYQFISRRWKTISADAKKFVVRLLMHDPKRRPSAAQALSDPWLTRCDFDYQGFAPEVALMDRVQATIQTFSRYGKLKKLALMLIAYRSTSEEIGFLRKMFDRFDLKHDGEVTLIEFKNVLADYEYTDAELEVMFRAMDLDGTGFVHYSEFLAATIECTSEIREEQVAECFDRLDNDDSGFISKSDIIDFLGAGIPQSYVDDIMKEADLDHDNKISYREFLGLWDQKGDANMKKDQEDVKKRRHRRADSAMSDVSDFSADFSDDEFDELAIKPTFNFEKDEIAKMLDAPDTPVTGKRLSAVNAFVLEKDRSIRASRNSLGSITSPATKRTITNIAAATPPPALPSMVS